ncbi:MAG: SocA family protein [Myxococcales bacterium]|nr:SocA family protein [Myxococcales bacterium]
MSGKSTELLLYLAVKGEEDEPFSLVKLNKLLYFIDKTAWLRRRSTVTGATYVKQPYGPVPDGMSVIRLDLEQRNEARLEERRFHQYEQIRLVAQREPDLSVFTADEIALIDEVFDRFRGRTATSVMEESHEDPGWKFAEMGKEIPRATWTLDNETVHVTDADREWAASMTKG